MPSTYSASLALELIATGEQAGLWGVATNTNLGGLLEEAIVGMGAVVFAADANTSIVMLNGASCAARCAYLSVTSSVSLTATRNLTVPTIDKLYLVLNSTTGGQSIQVKTAAGTGVTIPNGKTQLVYVDGTNVVDGITNLPATATAGGSTLVTLTGTQTLTNKTLTAPIIATISNTGALTLPTSTDTLVGRATTDTLTNKTLTTPVIATISNTGTLTLPTSTDTLVGRATTDTLTNKTMTTPILNNPTIGGVIREQAPTSSGTNTIAVAYSTPVSSLVAGQRFWVKLLNTITGQATINFDTLGALNVVSAAGFRLNAGALTAGRYYEFLYDGTSAVVVGGDHARGRTLLWEQSASASATLDFTGLDASYAAYELYGDEIVPATNDAALQARISIAAAFKSDANYFFVTNDATSASAVPSSSTATTATAIPLSTGSSSANSQSFWLRIAFPANTSTYKHVEGWGDGVTSTSVRGFRWCHGFYNSTSANDGVQILQTSGNMTSGRIRLYGMD